MYIYIYDIYLYLYHMYQNPSFALTLVSWLSFLQVSVENLFGAWQSAQHLVVRLLWDAWPMGPVRWLHGR